MAKKTLSKKSVPKHPAKKASWVVGHARFSKISAVEGIALTKAMTSRREQFDHSGMSAKERREAIIKTYKR